MTIDWAHFTPLSALAGGALIGLAAAVLILGLGRVMGAAGIVGGALEFGDFDAPWRWWLIVGLFVSPLIARALWGAAAPVFAAHGRRCSPPAAGRLRRRLGAGCTSGHGFCGLARLSPRSFVATGIFMARRSSPCSSLLMSSAERGRGVMKRNILALVVGLIFGLGLCLSGMYEPAKVTGFLDLAGHWDPSLAFVMGGAIAVALPASSSRADASAAWTGGVIDLPTARAIDAPLAVGSAIFGIGWGLAGVCPAPGVVDLGFFSPAAALFVVAMAAGMLIYRAVVGRRLPGLQVLTQDA